MLRKLFFYVGVFAAYYGLVRPLMLRWGALAGEPTRRLAGDELLPRRHSEATRAIDIAASPEAVWAFLSQMGREGTGFYNFDLVNNQNDPSYHVVRRDLKPVEAGMELDDGMVVAEVERGRSLVLRGALPSDMLAPSIGVITYVVEPQEHGSRLMVRTRVQLDGPMGLLQRVTWTEPLDFAFTVKQMLGVKQRAEALQKRGHVPVTP